MSFWDRVGDIAEKAIAHGLDAQTGWIIDLAREVGASGKDDIGASDVFFAAAKNLTQNPLGNSFSQGYSDANKILFNRDNASFTSDMAKPLDYEQRATSAFIRYAGDNESWRDAWKNAGQASPGQTLFTTLGLVPNNVTLANDPASKQAREDYFHNTWRGKYTSGTVDFLQNVFLDPTVIGGKALKGAKVAEITVEAGKAGQVVEKSKALDAGAKLNGLERTSRQAQKLNNLLDLTDGMSASEIAALPQFKRAGDAGAAMAYFFERANNNLPIPGLDAAESLAARRAIKRDLIGAMLGDDASIANLKAKHADLASELQRALDTPPQSRWADGFSWKDGGQGVLFKAQQEIPAEVMSHQARITQEMNRLDRVIAGAGSSGRIGFDTGEYAKFYRGQRAIIESTIYTGMAGRPIRVIQALAANRLPGHVNVADPAAGFEQLGQFLNSAKRLPADVKRDLLDKFIRATGQDQRYGVVQDAETAVFNYTAEHYGMTREVYDEIRKAGNTRRQAWLFAARDRLYSADKDARFVTITDPETDEITAVPRALLRSQLDDNVTLVDPVQLEKFIREGTNKRLFENWVGSKTLDQADAVAQNLSTMMMWGTRIWKDSALFRLAYPARVQVDTQMRLMAYMGTLNYLKEVPSLIASIPGLRPGSALDERVTALVNKRLAKAGIPEEDWDTVRRMITAQPGSHADLASEIAGRRLQEMRSTGQWEILDPDKVEVADWNKAYLRAVNQQIANSPTAMKFAEGATIPEVKKWLTTSAEGRKEWAELAGSNQNDIDQWLQRVEAHVDHYLPDGNVRGAFLQGRLNESTVDSFFTPKGYDVMNAAYTDRMQVHGEIYAPTVKNSLADSYERIRNRWYKWASDAPETVLGRSPLYAYAFKQKMAEIESRLGGKITGEELDNARMTADRYARREIGRILYDSSHVSNLGSHFRFIAPFFGAWEDMMKKWGALLYDKPWLVERGRQVWGAPNAADMVVDNNGNRVDNQGRHWIKENGKWRQLDPKNPADAATIGEGEYLLLPAKIAGSGALRINKRSFNIAFQGDPWWLPGLGPAVAVPANQLVRRSFAAEADDPVLKYVFPYGLSDESTVTQGLPMWIKQARNAFGGTSDYQATYTTLLAQETSKYAAGDRNTAPTAGEIAAKTRNWFILRAITANASPVSAQPTPELQFYVDQAHIYRQKYGRDWESKYDDDFGDYFRMRLSLSANETGIVASDAALKVAADAKYRKLISGNKEYGWLVVGPDNYYGTDPKHQFSQGAYTWEMTQSIGYGDTSKFRTKRDNPQDAIREVEISKGWNDYQKARTSLNLMLQKRGLSPTQLGNKAASDLDRLWNGYDTADGKHVDGYVDYLRQTNPSWAADFDVTDNGKAIRMMRFAMSAAEKEPSLAKRGDFVALQQYIDARRQVRALLAKSGKGLNAKENQGLKALWDGYVGTLVEENIGFEQMFNRGLIRDDLSEDI